MRTEMEFGEIFDELFFSCDLSYVKPEKEYYLAVQKKLGAAPEEILFWDDSRKQVEGARACGWQAEQFTDYETFRKRLKAYIPELPG